MISAEKFDNSSDFTYAVLSEKEGIYGIKVQSKPLAAQGGTGTVGIYRVYPNGEYDILLIYF